MAVNVKSRYWSLPPLDVPGENGATAALPLRPQPPALASSAVNHRINGVESLEYLAWQFYGSSTTWWHIADANELIFPLDYKPGMNVKMPQATGVGRVLRTRKF